MGVRTNFSRRGGQRRHFAYPLQVADDAMQIYFHKALYPLYIRKKVPYVTATVTKMRSLATVARNITKI